MKKQVLSIFVLGLGVTATILTPQNSLSADSVQKSTAKPITCDPEPSKKDKNVIWDAWYTVTVDKKIRYAYYNERVELVASGKGGQKIRVQTHLSKMEDGFIVDENLGAFSLNNKELTPDFFNFQSTYRSTTTKIDGSIQNSANGKKLLQVKVNKGDTDLKPVIRHLQPGEIFSSFFPVWIRNRLPDILKKKPISFSTIVEDNLNINFAPIKGTIQVADPDPFATKTQTHRLLVKYQDLTTTWWIKKNGEPCRIMMPKQNTVIEIVDSKTAKNFFDENP